VHRPAPAFGEHTREVLAEAGLAEDEIAALYESGAAAGPSAGEQQPFMA
jgi:crotonobetainyl-CoA:carnitine CoA-transferase CaiB-like acyl-CoA transferase